MDQQDLRRLEQQCIQEQPPWCVAACPLHIDARVWPATPRKANGTKPGSAPPLHAAGRNPRRICDAPCRRSCKRSEAGDPIEIGALERFCVSRPAPRQRVLPLPRKDKKVAVVGADLDGLTAAWDLARKGYRVEVFDSAAYPAAQILRRYPTCCPKISLPPNSRCWPGSVWPVILMRR